MKSESRFIWEQIFFLFKFPFLLLAVLFGKRKPSVLLTPLKNFILWIKETPYTYWLILLNLIAFIIELAILFYNPALIDQFAFRPENLFNFQIIPLFTSLFLHASLLHLFGNMIFLFVFGRVVEQHFKWRMLLIYFFAGLTAHILSAFFVKGASIGASGAIAGLIAVGILLHPFRFTYIAGGIPLPLFIVGWLGIIADVTNVLLPDGSNVNNFAHLGGYLAVTVVVFFASRKNKEKLVKGFLINIALLVGVFLVYFLL